MRPAHKKLLFASLLFLGFLLVVKITQANALTVDPLGKVIIEGRGEVLSKTTTTDDSSIKTEQKEDEKKTEITLPSGTRIKTREEPDRTRIDIYEGGTKLRLERKDDRTVVKLEDEQGEEMELPPGSENEVFKIEERADKGQVRVSTIQDKFVFSRENIAATTNFPLSVNLETNELTVTTPAGEKVVTILPDQAVKNMLAANVIDQTGTAPEEAVKLTATREGVLAYEIPGTKKENFLGFVRVDVSKTVVVSAETGELLETRQSLASQVLDFLSF